MKASAGGVALNWGNYLKSVNMLGGELFRDGGLTLPTKLRSRGPLHVNTHRSAEQRRELFGQLRGCLTAESRQPSFGSTRQLANIPFQMAGYYPLLDDNELVGRITTMGLAVTAGEGQNTGLYAVTDPALALFWQISQRCRIYDLAKLPPADQDELRDMGATFTGPHIFCEENEMSARFLFSDLKGEILSRAIRGRLQRNMREMCGMLGIKLELSELESLSIMSQSFSLTWAKAK